MALYLVRHGETAWNVEGRLQGQQDIPLNGRGRQQAEAVGHRLRKLIPDPSGVDFVASPLGRARETMEIMRASMRLDRAGYRLEPSLAELTFGDWEGLTWPEVMARDPAGARAREADKWGFQPPHGESYAMLKDRLMPFVESLALPAVLVSHGGVARVLLAALGGVPTDVAPLVDIQQGRVLILDAGRYSWD
jgi:probable phosphoglycerate mutase